MCEKDKCQNCGNCSKAAAQPTEEVTSAEETKSDEVNVAEDPVESRKKHYYADLYHKYTGETE